MNATEQKYTELTNIERPQVDLSIYTNSVFNSQEEYNSDMREFSHSIFGTIKDDLKSTPIIYNRNSALRLRACIEGTGIDFGFCFEHKFTKECILTIVVSKNSGWTYESSAKQDDGTFIERSATLTVASKEDLLNAVITELNTDLAYYANKRLTFK